MDVSVVMVRAGCFLYDVLNENKRSGSGRINRSHHHGKARKRNSVMCFSASASFIVAPP